MNTEIKRPKPRRLFSFDSVKSASSSRRSSSEYGTPRGPRPLNNIDLSNVQEGDELESSGHIKQRTEPIPETSPIMSGSEPSSSPSDPFADQASPSRLEPVRPVPLKPVRPFSPDIRPSTPTANQTSKARWESLRQHVLLAAPPRPMTPPQRPASAQSNVKNDLPLRSGTPKPSRFARLGFKHVVEQVQEAKGMVDEGHKLGEEIMRGCAAARYSDTARSGKERDIHGSLTTLQSTVGGPTSSTAGTKRLDYLLRPQSIASVSTATLSSTGPSLRFLYQILVYHSGPTESAVSINLPHESQVLSALLCPFLNPEKYSAANLEDERSLAMESFELVSKSWSPLDEAASVERCLWCTKAVGSLSSSPARTRILGSLWRLLVPGDRNRMLLSTQGFQTIISGLFLLLASLYHSSTSSNIGSPYSSSPFSASSFPIASSKFHHPPHPDINLLQELIPQVLSDSLGDIEDDRIEEVYGVEFSTTDRRHLGGVRQAIFQESLMITIENSHGTGEWLLCNVLEQYWPPQAYDNWTTLLAVICSRKLNSFCRFSILLLKQFIPQTPSTPLSSRLSPPSTASSSTFPSTDTLNFQYGNPKLLSQLVLILKTKIIPEAEALSSTELDEKNVLEVRVNVARVVLEIMGLGLDVGSPLSSPRLDIFGGTGPADSRDGMSRYVKWATDTLCQWYKLGDGTPWRDALEQTFQLVVTRDTICFACPLTIAQRLVQDPPPYPFPVLSSFLTSLSKTIPPVFFKPLFACAASDKDVIVANHLCTVQVHSKYVDDYWVRDVEMICMALMGDASAPDSAGLSGQWARLTGELIGKIQLVRHAKEASGNISDAKILEVMRFATMLEARLWLMIESKERTALLPPSQRMLVCLLFREFRLLTKSLKPAQWLRRTLQWFNIFFADEDNGNLEQDVADSVERILELYNAAREGVQSSHKRHTSMLASSVSRSISGTQSGGGKPLDLAATFVEHQKLLDSLSKGYPSKAMKLFVTMSTFIAEEDYHTLGPLLWQHCLYDNVDPSSTASACFLLMQCAEKMPIDLLAIIQVDLQTSDDLTRLEAVRKMSILINWRFQIMNQSFITDRGHRPFKLARPPLPFVATDMGKQYYVHMDDLKENKDKNDVPLELKQRLAELGWAEEDTGNVDPRQEWIKTPMSILPANQLERMEVGIIDVPIPSPLSSPQVSPRKLGSSSPTLHPGSDASALLRRNSSSGGPVSGVKRRAVFVPSLTHIFPRLAALMHDPNFAVASAARATILDLMRNDPVLLSRPVLESLAGENRDMPLAITTLTTFLHARRILPPPVTHHIFNNLAGFLKLISKHVEPDALSDYSLVIPVIACLAIQVSGMSIKEIRRSKLEHLVIPSGSLWFSSSAPQGPMFPRALEASRNPFEPVPPSLISITMIRVSQNMFFLSMLKRNYQEVQAVRKNMSRLVLPSLDDHGFVKDLELYDFMPRKFQADARPSLKNRTVAVLSLMISRSHILLVAQIFRSMSRHLSDRHELAVLIDGLNRILIAHGTEINIVCQVLIAFMVASTRFRRLFTTGHGYTLFMNALIKVYAENPSHPGIRTAIEYAISRFYALHKDSFLYQSISTIGQLAMFPDLQEEWFSRAVFDLFASLRKGSTSSGGDAAGIRNANKAEEREAIIMHTADEKPQTFLSAIRRVESQTGRQMSLQLPDEYESSRLSMDDFVRLFLTVIVHDLSISRAQHFLRLLRLLTPHLYNASASTRTVLADGIVALGAIMVKVFSKPRTGENMPKLPTRDEGISLLSADPDSNVKAKSKTPSDSKLIRLDYLKLVLSFGAAGGQVTLTVARHTMDEWGGANVDVLSTFLSDIVKMLLNREEPPAPKSVVAFLQELSPILHGNFTVLKLAEIPNYANDSAFCHVVVGEICTAGLAGCDLAASENQLMSLRYPEAIFLRDRPPTYQFLAGIILPFTLALKNEAQLIILPHRTDEHRAKLAFIWLRILFYSMTACQKSRKYGEGSQNAVRGGSFRSKPIDKGRQEATFWRSHLPTFMTALQLIKVIIIRGSADISSLPRIGIWERLASFFNTMLAEGSATFALKPESSSATTTPVGSPRASVQFDPYDSSTQLFVSTSSDLSRPGSPFSIAGRPQPFSRPRIVDYSLWSVLEFVSAYRSPLRMQLKTLMMEKVVALDRELQKQIGGSAGLRPFPTSPTSRRVSISVFSKHRQRGSFLSPSPDSSPMLRPSSSSLMPSPSLLEIPSRRPGYQISPITPRDHPGLPKIVHLGPTSPSAFPSISSPMIGAGLPGVSTNKAGRTSVDDGDTLMQSTKVKSLRLIHETYRRIRGVQAFMGYDLLLPFPGIHQDTSSITPSAMNNDEDSAFETWTTQQALAAITSETKALLEEFEENLGLDKDEVLVDVEPKVPPSPR
ncbi:hypothetical protein CPB84DRAFT_1814223 [Gymnopilus junonius]|uniref:Uncharacterized protein n=1 Tax=Gymnopilus junonius TaxID=109634 RepID=A0A9P5NUR1_GYMJU|nr:hypothetical protein CPB84DRAFT_1814223 [Gymnopilus junonius]